MKFDKCLRAELVPEWKEKYIDYEGLKIILSAIDLVPTSQSTPSLLTNNDFTISIPQKTTGTLKTYSISCIISRSSSLMKRMSKTCSNVIQKRIYSSQNVNNPIMSYESLWNQITSHEKEFFITLEDNLNKVEYFYEAKLSEALRHFDELKIQYKCMKESRKEWSITPGTTTPISRVEETKFRAKRNMDYNSAKKSIKKAIFEFYRGIELLKCYKTLNQTGFAKILKKYDKVAKRNGSEVYLPRIANYNFVKSPVLDKLIQEIEAFYINNFEGAKRQLQLQNKEQKSHYFVTWRVGLYIGLSIPLMIRAVDLAFSNRVSLDLFEHVIQSEMLHLYAACFIPILFLLLFGINMYIWSSFGINYKFIFDFNPRNNLDFKQFLEIPAFIMLIFCYTMLINMSKNNIWILLLVILCIFLCPFKILYYDARKWLMISLLRVIGSGFYHVEFRDFFIADILNSLTYTATLLFCTLGDCHENWTCIVPLLSSLPAWWRFVQCWKRYFDTLHKFPHLANAGKYFLSMATIWIYYFDISTSLSIGSQIISSTYSLIWDLLMDWSLLQLDSKNYLLRDNINFKSYIYYFAIISNGLLRFSWILKFTIPLKYNKLIVYAIGYFEMLRRWQWSLLRIENEHVNNCGQFRAVKEIPLPFEKEETIREKTGLQKILIPENNLFPTILFHDNSKFEAIYEEETNTNLAESTKNDMLTINRQRELSLISLEGGLKTINKNNEL